MLITNVESEFDNIYRITTDSGIWIDIFEFDKPQIGSKIEIHGIGANSDDTNSNSKCYTKMNGIVYHVSKDGFYVSFGGLLGYFPLSGEISTPGVGESIYVSYLLSK